MAATALLPPPGFILAGGRSSRMGLNKALLDLGQRTVLGHVVHRIQPQVCALALNCAETMPGFAHIPQVADALDGRLGPLAGILTGMRYCAARHPAAAHFATAPCDSPFLPLDLVEQLTHQGPGRETIVVASSEGRRHPVFGLWPVALADDLGHWLAQADNRRINAFLDRHHTITVEFPAVSAAFGKLDPFLNINTPEDFAEASSFLEFLA